MARLNFRKKIILAPMVKIGTLPTRLLALDYGADIVYTEEIIDWRLLRSRRVVNHVLDTVDYVDESDHTLILRIAKRERGHLVLQVGTADPDRAVKVALKVVGDVDGIDVNMGCPKSFSMKGGMGAALLSHPDKIRRILTGLVKAVGDRITVTCKIRILSVSRPEETVQLAQMIEATGVDALAVHGRTKDERPNDANHIDVIQEVVKSLKIPVIANGGSSNNRDSPDNTHEGIRQFWAKSGASSVMVARAAEWNLSVFQEAKENPFQVIQKYLDYAIHYDYMFNIVKYNVQQVLGSHQSSALGAKFLASATMEDLCQVFGRQQDFLERRALIDARTLELQTALEADQTGTAGKKLPEDDPVTASNLRQAIMAAFDGDDARGQQPPPEGDRTSAEAALTSMLDLGLSQGWDESLPVTQMHCQFIRGHYANGNDIPKSRLQTVLRKQMGVSDENKAVRFFSWHKDKMFRSVALIQLPQEGSVRTGSSASSGVMAFSSSAWEKNKRFAEQASAMVAFRCLDQHEITPPPSQHPQEPQPADPKRVLSVQLPSPKRLKTTCSGDR